MPYARNTSVPIEQSRAEIEQMITKRGADEFSYALRSDRAVIQFKHQDRVIRFILPLPGREQFRFGQARGRKVKRDDAAADRAREQGCREKWRALRLTILAKLESVEAGIEQFEQAFFAHVVDPGTNQTVYELLREGIQERYISCQARALALPAPVEGEVED